MIGFSFLLYFNVIKFVALNCFLIYLCYMYSLMIYANCYIKKLKIKTKKFEIKHITCFKVMLGFKDGNI